MIQRVERPVTRIAVLVFALVALAHLARIVLHVQFTVAGIAIPMWVSVFGIVVPGLLSVLLWREACR